MDEQRGNVQETASSATPFLPEEDMQRLSIDSNSNGAPKKYPLSFYR